LDQTVKQKIPVSAIIATANRAIALDKTLNSLSEQSLVPKQIIVVDASDDDASCLLCKNKFAHILWVKANAKGAAAQRNQGVALALEDFILFMDDDIIFEPECIAKLWLAINSSIEVGGVNAMITNQQYHAPGFFTRCMYLLMHGKKLPSYAGMCIGPAWNLLPEDKEDYPDLQSVDWLNTTCTLYRKSVLPDPVFTPNFTGYSLMEDLALSLLVAQKSKLYNTRKARIFHDSQAGEHKSNIVELSKMELINRHYVMVKVLNKKGITDYLKLFLFEFFGILSALRVKKNSLLIHKIMFGKLQALRYIISS